MKGEPNDTAFGDDSGYSDMIGLKETYFDTI